MFYGIPCIFTLSFSAMVGQLILNKDKVNIILVLTVSVISCDPLCKDDNARFTTVSLKLCLTKYELNVKRIGIIDILNIE